jgi:ribonuclease HI
MEPLKETHLREEHGGILYFSHNHFLSFKAGTGRSTNNHNKLTTLKLVLILAIEKGITQIQVLGDSLLVIKWMKGESMH